MAATTMRALIFDGESVRLDKSYPAPIAQLDHAIVRVIKAIVSRTDVDLCSGQFAFRGPLGHQFVGVVESVDGSSSKLVGKRVVASPIIYCGKCDMCVAGLSRHCRNRTIIGMKSAAGCLADRVALPVKNLFAVPDSVDDDHAAFAAGLSAAIQAAEQLTIVGKPYITVLGDGPLGLMTAQVMAKLNASVRLIGNHAEKLAICEKWGIKHRHIDEVGRRADQDVVVDCTGSAHGLVAAMTLVRPRGKIVLKSLLSGVELSKSSSIDLTPLVLNEIEVIGSFYGPVNEALAMLAKREVDVLLLISKRLSLSDGAGIVKAAKDNSVIAVVVEP